MTYETIQVPGRRLGRVPNPPEKVARLLKLDNYLAPLPAAPETLDLTPGIPSWPMYLNDRLGDCTCAAAAHMLEIFSKEATGTARLVQDSDVLALYETQGYKPNDPASDRGASEVSVLDSWRHTGLAGDKLYAYATCAPSNLPLVKTATWMFYGLYIGVAMPLTAQGQTVWDLVQTDPSQSGAGTWGGHAVNCVGFDGSGFTIITWGATKRMTLAFWNAYVDEAYALIPDDFESLPTRPLDNGFDVSQLNQDLAAVGAVDPTTPKQ